MMPTECFLVVDKDRHGRPRGLEKANGKIYLTYFDAAQDCGTGQCVVECVIKERGSDCGHDLRQSRRVLLKNGW